MKNNKALTILMLLFAAVAVSALVACSTDLSSVESRIDQIENRMDSEYATIEADQKAIAELQVAMEAEHEDIRALIDRIELDEKAIADLQAAVAADNAAIHADHEAIQELQSAIDAEQEDIRALIDRIELDEKAIADLQAAVEADNAAIHADHEAIQELQSAIDAENEDIRELIDRLELDEKAIEELKAAVDAENEDIRELIDRLELDEKAIEELKAALDAENEVIHADHKAIQDLQTAMEAEQEDIKALIERITLDEKIIAELQKQIEDLSARIGPEPTPTPEAEAQDAEPQPAPQLPPPTMTKLDDNVYHYFGFFTSSLVVIADDGVLITDPSNFPRGQSLKEEIAKLTSAPVTTIVLTHEHYDHVGGTGLFPDAQVVCHRNCEATFDLDTLGDVPAEVHQTFDDMMEITVGDKTVQLHYLGPGDGDATTIIYMPDEQIIVTADMYEPRALTHKNWVHDKNFVGTRSILNTISKWPIKYAINGHSPGTDPIDMMENVEYYNDLYDTVKVAVDEAIMQAGGAVFAAYGLYDTLPQTLELEKYKEWVNYDNSFPSHVERMLLSIYHGD